MRRSWPALVASLIVLCGFALLHAAPDRNLFPDKKDEPKTDKTGAFKPIEINNELIENDPNDPKLNHPAKKYTIKLSKDKSYLIDLVSKDFDAFLRLLNNKGDEVAEDDDGGGNLDSRIIYSPPADGDHEIVATSLDGKLGKFQLKVRELVLKGEAKPRAVGKDGITIAAEIGNNDQSAIGKLGRLFSVELKKGQTYTIDLETPNFDAYLYLFDGKSKLLSQDDDGGDGLNSRIVFRADRDGVFHILASSLDGDETGEFSLKVSEKE